MSQWFYSVYSHVCWHISDPLFVSYLYWLRDPGDFPLCLFPEITGYSGIHCQQVESGIVHMDCLQADEYSKVGNITCRNYYGLIVLQMYTKVHK